MIIEDAHDRVMQTLNLGCFPKLVVSQPTKWSELPLAFERLVYGDYIINELIQTQFGGDELPDDSHVLLEIKQKLTMVFDVVDSAKNIADGYCDQLYYAVVKAHLCFLDGSMDEMKRVLTSVSVSAAGLPAHTLGYQLEFIQYLTVRYYVLLGLTNWKYWLEYLTAYSRLFLRSQVAANHWLRNLFYELGLSLAANGNLVFAELADLPFYKNERAVIGFGLYVIIHTKLVDTKFVEEFMLWLDQVVVSKISDNRQRFPDANTPTPEIDDFVNNLYILVEQYDRLSYPAVSARPRQRLLKPLTLHQYLVAQTSRTYQLKGVVSNLVYTLLAQDQYDEAFLAFLTIKQYNLLTEAHHHGYIEDILALINLYLTCIIEMHPALRPDFLYADETTVVAEIASMVDRVKELLGKFGEYADISVGGDLNDDLGFLYTRYNPNVVVLDRLNLVEVVSHAWYAVGFYYLNLAVWFLPTLDQMTTAVDNAVVNLRNAVTVNSTGNATYLYTYALALSHTGRIKLALKLCKFILKRYPEMFKTWNLMTLILSAVETNKADLGKETSKSELEKFIDNALNIAGLYTNKHKDRMSLETKYEILQLKLTQMAVLERNHGIQYILEHLTDVFVLFHELLSVSPAPKQSAHQSPAHDSSWSHRPSFIDPGTSNHGPVANGGTPHANGHVVQLERKNSSALSRRHSLSLDRFRRSSSKKATLSKDHHVVAAPAPVAAEPVSLLKLRLSSTETTERKIMQQLWLWTARIYMRVGLADEAEQCLVEAELIYEPNVRTFTALGYLTSESRKFLALQEFERLLEIMNAQGRPSLEDYGTTVLGLAKLFILDDKPDSLLFLSTIDRQLGIIRVKKLLEVFSTSFGYGYNSPEVWYFLSKVYEVVDDKVLLKKLLWKCVDLEDYRPVRAYSSIEGFLQL